MKSGEILNSNIEIESFGAEDTVDTAGKNAAKIKGVYQKSIKRR